MMSRTWKAISLVGLLMLSGSPLLAVNGGAYDGNAHPAVGFIYGTLDTDPCSNLVFGCTGVLIDPTVVVTSAECASSFADARKHGYDIQAIWVSFDSSNPYTCGAPSLVQQIAVNPAWDANAAEPAGNVGVMILADAAPVPPASLPAESQLNGLVANQSYTVVAFGDADGGSDTAIGDLARRSTTAFAKRLDAEQLTVSLRQATKAIRPCVGQDNEAGAVYLGATDEVEALLTIRPRGSCWVADSQRLDVPSVRDFLAGFVTLP